MTTSLGHVSISNCFVSLFIFYIFSYLLSKRTGCLSGCLVSPPAFTHCFVEFVQCSNDLSMNFVEEKVVSPSYSCTILGPPHFKLYEIESKVSQSHLTLCGHMDCSPPGSSIHGIFQAKVREWVAISSSRGFPDFGIKSGFSTLWADALPSEPSEKPY